MKQWGFSSVTNDSFPSGVLSKRGLYGSKYINYSLPHFDIHMVIIIVFSVAPFILVE